MAKSIGNVVNPFFALDRFGVDTMRWYLAYNGGIRDDADYENAFIIEGYTKVLQGGLGNLTSRVLRGKQWSVQRAVINSKEPQESGPRDLFRPHADAFMIQQAQLEGLPGKVRDQLDNANPGGALTDIMLMMRTVTTLFTSPCFNLD